METDARIERTPVRCQLRSWTYQACRSRHSRKHDAEHHWRNKHRNQILLHAQKENAAGAMSVARSGSLNSTDDRNVAVASYKINGAAAVISRAAIRCGSAFTGRVITTSVPRPDAGASIQMRPVCASTRRRAIGNPSPTLVRRPSSGSRPGMRKNFSKTCSRNSAGTPGPSSATEIRASTSSSFSFDPGGLNLGGLVELVHNPSTTRSTLSAALDALAPPMIASASSPILIAWISIASPPSAALSHGG